MEDHKLPKMCLFNGWKDMAKNGLKAVQVGRDWHSVAQDRGKWRNAWSQNLVEHQTVQQRGQLIGEKNVLCVWEAA